MKKSVFIALLFCFIIHSNGFNAQTVFALWNFNNFTRNPQIGTGSLITIGGVTELWDRTGVNIGVSTPAGILEVPAMQTGVGFQTLNYPAQGTNPRTAGIQVNVSTLGFKNILFSVDMRQGGTSANKISLLYTVDGINWVRAVTYTTDDNDSWYLRNFNFSNIPAVNNNSLFAIRLVTNFDDDVIGSDVYVSVRTASGYLPTGPIRFDNVRFRGEALDAPEDDRTVIAGWNFDALNRQPSSGSGTLSIIGGITEDWTRTGVRPNQTIVGEGVFDVAALREGAAIHTINYPAIGSANKTAGIQMNVNTTGFRNIIVSADVRRGNTAANNMFIQYSVDGINWIDANNMVVNSGDTWFKHFFDFSSIQSVNNNPLFAIRYVTAFHGSTYAPTRVDRTYSITGPIRFDNVEVKGHLLASTPTIFSKTWRLIERRLVFDQMPTEKISIYTVSGKLIQVIEPSNDIQLNLQIPGMYIFRTGQITGKFFW